MATQLHQAVLLLGSNIRPGKNLALGVALLRQHVTVEQLSSVWQTVSVGSNGPDFLNQAVLITTTMQTDQLKEKVLRPLETQLGRLRSADRNAARTIDIDIILFDGQLMDQNLFLQAHRAIPVAELLPDLHSSGGETLKAAAARLTKTTSIRMEADSQRGVPLRSKKMNKNPLIELENLGQSIWLDTLSRGVLENGQLKRWIDEDGASGLTSNPSIFEKAIAGSDDYDTAIRALAQKGMSVEEIYQSLTVQDIQNAADLFRPMYDRLQARDGFVSLEVSPGLAHDTAGTIAEARQLWAAVGRPNLFIKVPATREGLPAIRQLIGEGINVNITLLFGLPRYREVAEAYLSGLETLAASGKPLDRIASVASFFLSRIDVLVDPLLDKFSSGTESQKALAHNLHGQVAIASARVAYRIYKEIFTKERFLKLAQMGARSQRLLWASTGTKDPAYSDLKYVEPLIGKDTINTLPIETLDAYRQHGQPSARIEQDAQAAQLVLDGLPKLNIDLDALTQQLENEGVAKFIKAFAQSRASLTGKQAAILQSQPK